MIKDVTKTDRPLPPPMIQMPGKTIQVIDIGSDGRFPMEYAGFTRGKGPAELDRKVLRETLYSGIFHRHRRTIFALGSFLRMLKTKKSNYNVIKHEGDGE